MRQRRNHSPLTLLVIIAMMVGSVCAQAQLPVRTRQVQLFSNNNTNYTILRSADGQTTNWSLIQPPTVGTTGSLQLSTVGGSDAQLSWLAPGAAGYMLGISAGIPAWVDPATYLNGSFWSVLGNAGTNPATNFIGTTDAQPLVFRTNNTETGRFLSTGELQLASIAGAVNATVPVGYDRFLVADASGNVDQVEYAAVINQNAWSLLGNAGTNAATNYLGTSDAQPLVVRTNATERLRVNATGEVGIGTTATAGYLLHVNGTAGTPNVRLTSISGVAAASVPAGFDRIMLANSTGDVGEASTSAVIGAAAWTLLGNTGTNPATNFIGTTDAQPLVFRTNNTETGRFLSTGELQLASIAGAVNATVPVGYDRFLVADASGNVDQVEYAAVINQNAWSLLGNAGTNAATNYLGTSDAQPLVVRTNATERLRVNATGEVGIGTTAPAGYLLHVNGTAGTPNVRLTSISGVAAASVPAGFDRIMLANSTGDVGEASTAAVIGTAAWTLFGNTGTNPATNFIGTTDAQPLVFRTNNTEAGRFLSTGELQLASIAGAVNATVPVGYDRFLVADASGNVDQVEYAAVINQHAWSLLGNAGTNAATNYL
ncbi:MAG: hypothetical protein J5I53_09460, partial [Bradyrhizobiaceae bacterium]|nr:hypothetical protein [Bradyrhizobiaceae bacterium]